MQRQVLYAWFIKFEKSIIRTNTRNHGIPSTPAGGAGGLKSAMKKSSLMAPGGGASGAPHQPTVRRDPRYSIWG